MKKYLKYIIIFIISISIIILTYNNYFLYNTPIVRVTSINNITNDTSEFYTQQVKGIFLNTEYKGMEVEFENIASKSSVYDEKLRKNSEVFVELNNDNSVSITNIKRDKYIVILLVIFIDLILIVNINKGLKTIISLIINIFISILSIIVYKSYYKSLNILLLYFIVSCLFIILSLYITNGKSKKTLAAIVSSIISLFSSFILIFIIIKLFGKNINIWTISYIEAMYDYENFFYVCILLSSLGAIMDISITMASSINELILKDNNISKEKLIISGKEIGKDVVGTMINVMLFTIYTSIIPSVFLVIKNSMNLSNALAFYGEIDLIIVLTSAISIVLSIPIGLYTSIFVLKREVYNK